MSSSDAQLIYECFQEMFGIEEYYMYDISKAYIRGTYTSVSTLVASWSQPSQFINGQNGWSYYGAPYTLNQAPSTGGYYNAVSTPTYGQVYILGGCGWGGYNVSSEYAIANNSYLDMNS